MTKKTQDVFLLWHTNPDNDNDAKLIGVYSTQKNAEKALLSVQNQPGFIEYPEYFEICPYRLDMTSWAEGFTTIKD